jgi:hypothetical protein
MSDTVTIDPRPTAKLAADRGKSTRKAQPPASFPHRLTVCFAPDQVENLQVAKVAFRASESFVIRMAFDLFCRTQGFVNNGGQGNVR